MKTMKIKHKDDLYVLVPYKKYQQLKHLARRAKQDEETSVPHAVVGLMIMQDYTPIKAWRTYLKLTQTQVAESLGITQAAFSQIENNSKNQNETLEKIATVFKISPESLKIPL